jgi:hypothetical protein
MSRMSRTVSAVLVCCVLALVAGEAAVKIKTQHDKRFAFKGVRTWNWHPNGAGETKMAVTADDNPAAVHARFSPVVQDALVRELGTRGIAQAAEPQLYVNYYLLISTSVSSQTMGQFVPAVPDWGLPPFAPATQSMKVIEQGSLLVDVTEVASKRIVWRGMAQAEIHLDRTPAQRDTNLRAAIADLLKKLPKTS